MSESYERVEVVERGDWRSWLEAHHGDAPGVWVVTYKKGADPARHVAYDAIVEEALCFGWIDSVQRRVDDQRTRLLLTPRKRRSKWSRSNKDRVARLDAEGRMAAAGRAAVERARSDGTWTALDDVEQLVEPDDLRAALEAAAGARRHWDAFPRSVRRGILEWIADARRPATRAKRVRDAAELAARGERANQWPRA